MRQALEAGGASLLYLPSYSPDLNPIEQLSPNSRRSPQAAARTLNALVAAIAEALNTYTAEESKNSRELKVSPPVVKML